MSHSPIHISSIEDVSTISNEGREFLSSLVDTDRMGDAFDIELVRERLKLTIEQSGRSMREIALSANVSPGYVFGILNEGKEPGISRLSRICASLNVSLSYILYGLHVSRETEEIMSLLEGAPEKRSAIRQILSD